MSKVKEVSPQNVGTWDSPNGMLYKFKYTFDDGVTITANHKTDAPKFKIGDEVEYEVTKENEYGKLGKVSKPNSFKGGSRKITQPFKEVIRMCRSNAVDAVATVNSAYNEERLDGKAIVSVLKFTQGDITSDVEKYSNVDSLLTSRLSSVKTAAKMASYRNYNSAEDLITEASKIYKYITK